MMLVVRKQMYNYSQTHVVRILASTCRPENANSDSQGFFPTSTRTREYAYSRVFPRVNSRVLARDSHSRTALTSVCTSMVHVSTPIGNCTSTTNNSYIVL